jgi:hypothetical protein
MHRFTVCLLPWLLVTAAVAEIPINGGCTPPGKVVARNLAGDPLTAIDFGTAFEPGQADTMSIIVVNVGGREVSGVLQATCSQVTLVTGGGPYTLQPDESFVAVLRCAFLPDGSDCANPLECELEGVEVE